MAQLGMFRTESSDFVLRLGAHMKRTLVCIGTTGALPAGRLLSLIQRG